MKSPQQIKNEVEKKGLEILKRLQDDVKEGRCFLVIEKDYPSYLNVVDNEVNMAELSILTEYDKSIKEMIEDRLPYILCYGLKQNLNEEEINQFKKIFWALLEEKEINKDGK